MNTVNDGREVTEEIGKMLQGMTAEQKLRARDILAGIMLYAPLAKKNDDVDEKKAG